MAIKSFKPALCSILVLLTVSSRVSVISEARPLKLGSSWSSIDKEMESVFDGLFIDAMKKEGPSSGGKGHAFTDSETLGGIKHSMYIGAMKNEGPSSGGNGHAFTDSETLGGIKHVYIGAMKNGGPSSGGDGHAFTDSETLGGIKHSGPSSGGSGN
ncbi:PREDICTED: LOC110010106 [Prunus dulcis]|uniref:PREDICTED: LOC110010106 n=1 Tax=Prunus dulcis TaxID=3755 RepID=A0A5E4E9N7_PRUDU|nr:PREDICTED: LOC110010106 [Prunus dulcis]